MSDKEILKSQPIDPQKPVPEQKPASQPVQQKPQIPVGQPKSPQPEHEKVEPAQKKEA